MAAAGALESIVLKGRRFSTGADDTPNIATSSWSNETVMHSDGTFDIKKTRVPGHITGVKVSCANGKDDQEYIDELQAELEPFPVNATLVDGTVYTGQMHITDQGERDLTTNYMELSLEGTLEKMG